MDKKKCYSLLTLLIIIIALVSGCSTGSFIPLQIRSGKEITFFTATDIHYLSKNLTDGGEAFKKFIDSGDGKQLQYIDEIVDAFTRDIKKEKPDFLIISGDLTSNGEKMSHIDLAKKLKFIEKAGTQVYVIPGNHDILNPYAREFKGGSQYKTDYISDKDFAEIYGDFGYNEAISRDKSTLSYLAAPSKKVWLLMLDTNNYKNNEILTFPQTNGSIGQETFEWIKECSKRARENKAQLVAVMHHNLIDHVDVLSKGYTLDNSSEAVKVFQECGIKLVLSGHIHIQNIKYVKNDAGTIYDIATSALSVYPQQYGVIKYNTSSGFDYTTAKVDVEGYAREKDIQEPDIFNFNEYSRKLFKEHDYNKTFIRLLDYEQYTDEQRKAMAETMSELNLVLFSGEEKTEIEKIKNSTGFKLWLQGQSDFRKKYIMSIIRESDFNNTKAHIEKTDF